MIWRAAKCISIRTSAGRAGLHSSIPRLAATHFAMPAMSPTMTEGNIASWKMKEGDTYAAGDVILEIETDKATMDVEASDDGVLAKILIGDGQKNVQVGTNIAIMAEMGDDLASLETPSETSKDAPMDVSAPEESAPPPKNETLAETSKPAPASSHVSVEVMQKDGSRLSPAVASLLSRLGISDYGKIKASGPAGRLIKGDVLAFAKKIDQGANEVVAKAYTQRSKLDLSNIKKAPQEAKDKDKITVKTQEVAKDSINEVHQEINLARLVSLAERSKTEHNVALSVQDLLTKATVKALKDVPTFYLTQLSTSDILFDEIVSGIRRSPVSQIQALSPQSSAAVACDVTRFYTGGIVKLPVNAPESASFRLQPVLPRDQRSASEIDILDLLCDRPAPTPAQIYVSDADQSRMLASLSFKDNAVDAKTAALYLDRVAQYVENPAHLFIS